MPMTSQMLRKKTGLYAIIGTRHILVANDILAMPKKHIRRRLQFVQGSPLYSAKLTGIRPKKNITEDIQDTEASTYPFPTGLTHERAT